MGVLVDDDPVPLLGADTKPGGARTAGLLQSHHEIRRLGQRREARVLELRGRDPPCRELEQTIAAATEPWRTLFILAALTGARVSELLALTWEDVKLDDLADAEIQFAHQVDRKDQRRPTKTDGSARTVPIPHELAVMLVRHKLAARFAQAGDFVFATRTGEAIRQRNVCRALRTAQRDSIDDLGRPTFPALHQTDAQGDPARVAHGELPSMHSFRHTVASRALLAGESVDEIAFLLGHRDANVTRAVYVRELADARRRSMRRSRMVAEFSDILKP